MVCLWFNIWTFSHDCYIFDVSSLLQLNTSCKATITTSTRIHSLVVSFIFQNCSPKFKLCSKNLGSLFWNLDLITSAIFLPEFAGKQNSRQTFCSKIGKYAISYDKALLVWGKNCPGWSRGGCNVKCIDSYWRLWWAEATHYWFVGVW